jgi:hypothetical protein
VTINDPTVEFKWRKSTSVNIIDPYKIPQIFMRHIPETFVPDKALIKKSLSTSKDSVDGCELQEKLNLTIK